jgi:hypothetical protein
VAARRFATIPRHFAAFDYFTERDHGFDGRKNELMTSFLLRVVRASEVTWRTTARTVPSPSHCLQCPVATH